MKMKADTPLIVWKHGISLGRLEILSLFGDDKTGDSYLVRGTKGQELEVRVTPSGYLRIGRLKERTEISVDGTPEAKASI